MFSKLNIFKKKDKEPYITEISNVIQYDDMGYPLRLCINREGKQICIDTIEYESDVVLRWSKFRG